MSVQGGFEGADIGKRREAGNEDRGEEEQVVEFVGACEGHSGKIRVGNS